MCTGIAIYAFWYCSAGLFPVFPPVDNTYIDLGESFLHGQLSLLEKPDPRLATLSNPYDPAQRNIPYHWDASYYQGKYYLYWGPVPALAFAALEGVIHIRPPGSLIVIICYVGLSIIFLAILFQIWYRFFPSTPNFSPGLFVLVGFINLPFIFLLGRPVIYETSVIAGQFFLLLGLLSWIIYTTNTDKFIWLFAAGLNWGLAIGSRYNLAISVMVYVTFACIQIIHVNKGYQIWRKFALLLVPLALCIIGLGVYNFARFSNPLETGFTYQLSIPEAYSDYYSMSYLPSNFYIYFFYPMTTLAKFPFVLSTLPVGKQFDEIVAGLFPAAPNVNLLLLAIPLLIFTKTSIGAHKNISIDKSFKPLIAMIALAGLGQLLFLFMFFYVAMRYIADFYLPLTLGLAILAWWTDALLCTKFPLRIIFWLIVIGLIFWTAGIGFFGGFDIPPQTFRVSNPTLYLHLATYWNGRFDDFISLLKVFHISKVF